MQTSAKCLTAVVPTVVAVVAGILIALAIQPRTASASLAIAKSTGKSCSACHTKLPALNDYGKKYKASHKK